MEIVRANESHIQEISRLFDLYRQFYRYEPNIDLATQFIRSNILHELKISKSVDSSNKKQLSGIT